MFRLLMPLLAALVTISQGYPNREDEYYNEQEYQYDYDDDKVDYSEENRRDEISFRPQIVSDPVKLDVDNGMTIRLPCLVDKLPAGVQIIWSKVDSHSTQIAIGTVVVAPEYMERATVTEDARGSTLHIGIAKSGDAGKYKCSVAVRGEQPSLNHEVRIRAPPSVDVSTPSLLEVKKGDDVTLNCRASGKPAPVVKWARVGKLMPDGSSEIQSDVVTFSNVNRKHAGTYRCTADNGHGREASKTVEVAVEYRPEIEVTEMFVHSQVGEDSVELVCSVHAHPRPAVAWVRRGQGELTNSGRVKLENIGSRHTLTIAQVRAEDFGEYECRATNSLGSQQAVIELSGLASSPEFTSDQAGSTETEFLLQWRTKSFTPVTQFRLEVRERGTSSWRSYTVTAHKDGAYHWAGKQFLSDLSGATQYQARVSAENAEGWSKPGKAWSFATLGAVPSPASVTGAAPMVSSSLVTIVMTIMVCLNMVRH